MLDPSQSIKKAQNLDSKLKNNGWYISISGAPIQSNPMIAMHANSKLRKMYWEQEKRGF